MSKTIKWDEHTVITEEALLSLVGQHAPVLMDRCRMGTATVVSASVDDGVLMVEVSLSKRPPLDTSAPVSSFSLQEPSCS